jgi:hypothetical protein
MKQNDMTIPKHDTLTFYPKWKNTSQLNATNFIGFLWESGLQDDATQAKSEILAAPSTMHWATVAQKYVHLHWS